MSASTFKKPRALLVALLAATAALWAEPSAAQTEQHLELEVNEGQIIRLPRPAQNVFIGNPKVADVSVMSPRIIYVFGKKTGATSFYALDANERIMAKRDVKVGHNLSRLRDELNQLVPGGIHVSSVNAGIVLSGQVPSERHSEDAKLLAKRFLNGDKEQVINRLEIVLPNQVNIRVRIAEVTQEVLEQLQFNWEKTYDGAVILGVATGNPVLAGSLSGISNISPASPAVEDNLGTPAFLTRTGTSVDSIFGGGHVGDFDVNGVLDILAEDGLVAILAEPNLTAVSGETASFLAGGEFPIPIATDADTISIEFKEFGVSLSFTPTVLDDRRISLLVRPEVSQL